LIAVVFIIFYPDLYFFYLILFLFAFVTVHELSHSLVARHYKIRVRRIVLYPIGGVSEIEEIPENPKVEWRMAAAGPLTSFVIGGILFALNQVIVIAEPSFPLTPSLTTAGSLLLDLALLNVILGAFNFIPAFPMDGGRVFRAFLAERMSFTDATRYAALIGRIFGIGMIFFGILFLQFNIFLVIVGIFVYIGASEEAEQTIVSTALAHVRVREVMQTEVAAVTPETSVEEALEVMFRARYHDILVEQDGVLRGIITWDEVDKVKPEKRKETRLAELPIKQVLAFPEESILEAYKLMTAENVDLLPVVERDAQTKVIGVLTSEGVARAYERARALR
jgi:Zn-dependent protease